MKHTLLLTYLVYFTIKSTYSIPVSQTKSNNLVYIGNDLWEISDPAITFKYPTKHDNVPILLEEDTFYGNLNNNYVPDNNEIDLSNLEYNDRQSDDTFICIGSPKCPKDNKNHEKDNFEQKLDIIEDEYILIEEKDNKNHPNVIDTKEDDSLGNEEPIDFDNNDKNVVSPNNTYTKQISTIDYELLYLLYNIINNINTDNKYKDNLTNKENGKTDNINSILPGILTNIIKNNVFINEYRPINANLVDNKEKLESEKTKEYIDLYKEGKNKYENATDQENVTGIKVPMINIINNTISVDSNNSIKLSEDKNMPSKFIVHIINGKDHFSSSESNNNDTDNGYSDQNSNDIENETVDPISNN